MKKYLSLILFPTISILTIPLIFTIFNLFSININKFITTLFIVIIMIITGILFGKKITNKGYIKGLLLGISISAIMFLLSIILGSSHSIYNILYYLIIIGASTLGTMIGISKSNNNS